jgi:protein-S-isoprenylcysteine O-methyltransferase Ste14
MLRFYSASTLSNVDGLRVDGSTRSSCSGTLSSQPSEDLLEELNTFKKKGSVTRAKMKEKNGEHPFGDTGQLLLLGLFLIVWLVDSFFFQKSTFLSDYVPLHIRLAILGLALITAAYLFLSGHVVVSHEKRPTQVVSTGAFRHVRHPLYLGSILFHLGLSVSTASLFSLGLLVVIFVFYNYIASYEEKLLDKRFGEGYTRYKERTGKWLPRIGRGN